MKTEIFTMSDKIVVNYKYKLKPNKHQRSVLWNILQNCRHQYNEGLELWSECWECCRVGLNYFLLNDYFKDKYTNVYSQVKQNVNKRLETAFKNFFAKHSRYPKYKSARQYRSFTYPQKGFQLDKNFKYVKLSGIGKVRIVYSQPIVGKIKTCTIKLSKTNEWYACFAIEVTPENFFEIPKYPNNNVVGLDIGLKTFATLSDGTQVENPKYLLKSEKKLKRAQRRLSRKKKGSSNRRKQCVKIAKLHEHIANQRRDFCFKTAHQLVNNYNIIVIEDLSPKFMIKNRWLAKSASDVSISQFFNILKYEAFKHNTLVVAVDPKNTSQLCSNCKQIVPKELSERIHRCPYCGLTCDRDVNAAVNIVDRVPVEFKLTRTLLRNGTAGTAGTYTPVETGASGSETGVSELSSVVEAGRLRFECS